MKQTLTFFAAILLLAVGATAQKLSYQAVVRNNANELVAGATVQVAVSILNATGNVQYAENHANVQTNLNGLLSLMIGDGTPTGTATMADVVWTGASVKTIITLPGGVSVTSVTPVNAVPYALYADNVDPSVVEDAVTDYIATHGAGGEANVQADWNVTDPASDAYIQNKPTNVSSFDNDANYITAADIPAIPTVPADVSAFNNDANYITNTGSCANSVDLCDLLEKLELLENQIQPIMILTGGVTEVSTNSFTVNGKVLTNGSTTITQRGFVYATSHNPTLENNSVNNGSGTGEYTSSITGLTAGTTYYVRAFAGNDNGTYYGNEVAVTTTAITPSTIPSVTTIAATNITKTQATVSGNVTSDGGETVLQRGFVYDTLANPNTNSNKVTNGSGTGSYANLLNQLKPGKTYYIRAYAINNQGTAYGNELTFSTVAQTQPDPVGNDGQPCSGTPTVADHEGNVYNTVQIGTQCWTKENMRAVTSPSTGTYLIPPAGTTFTYTGKQARWSYGDSATYAPKNYGVIYNWNAAIDTFNTQFSETSVIPFDYSDGVDYPVSVLFSGHRRGICPAGWHVPSEVEWKTLSDYVSSQDNYIYIDDTYDVVVRNSTFNAKALASTTDWKQSNNNFAVGNIPNTNNATGFNALPADLSYNYFTSATFWSVTQYNNTSSTVVYNFKLSYDLANSLLSADNKSSFYSVRCLKDENSGGDTPGGNTSDNTPIIDEKSCTLTPTVTDVDGNTYSTVQIGDQCWMRENLRTTHYSNGDTILFENARKYPNNDQSNVAEYGYLYQWYATMHLDNSYQGQNLDIQGICPTGWHVPSYAEWGVLADYAGQNYYGLIASTGFSTQLAGRYWDGYHNFGERNYFWTRDYVVNQAVHYRFMDDAMNLSSNGETENAYAFFSVRCLRD